MIGGLQVLAVGEQDQHAQVIHEIGRQICDCQYHHDLKRLRARHEG